MMQRPECQRRSRAGLATVEYVVLLGLIAIAVIIGALILGPSISRAMTGVSAGGSGGPGHQQPGPPTNNPGEPIDEDFSDPTGHGNWTYYGSGWQRQGNQLVGAGPGGMAIRAVGGNGDYVLTTTLQTVSSVGQDNWNTARAVFRFQDADNYYSIVPNRDGVVELAKMQNGEWRPWLAYARADIDPYTPHTYQVKVKGDQIEIAIDGKLLIQYTDPDAILKGGVGVANDLSSATLSKLSVNHSTSKPLVPSASDGAGSGNGSSNGNGLGNGSNNNGNSNNGNSNNGNSGNGNSGNGNSGNGNSGNGNSGNGNSGNGKSK